MLNEKELMEFLRLLAAFADATGLSGTAAGRLLGVSKKSMCRWLAAAYTMLAYNVTPEQTVYRFHATNAINQIRRYNELDKKTGIYEQIGLLDSTQKVQVLSQAFNEVSSARAS